MLGVYPPWPLVNFSGFLIQSKKKVLHSGGLAKVVTIFEKVDRPFTVEPPVRVDDGSCILPHHRNSNSQLDTSF